MSVEDMRDAPSNLSRRRALLLTGAAVARLGAVEPDFWITKPVREWSVAEIYQLTNRSPWAKQVQWWGPPLRTAETVPSKMPAVPPGAVVVWESAKPILDALKRDLPAVFADHYVVSFDGPSLGDQSMRSLAVETVLEAKSKPKVKVSAALVGQLIRNSVVYAFGFPKKAVSIGPDCEEVVFRTQFGTIWKLEATFKPKEMLYHGEVAV